QGNPVPRADVTIRQVRHEFIFGGQIPFWLIDPAHSDRGADQQAILRRADEMFEQVIPSAVTWGWVEPERGELDFSRYDYAAGWARDHDKRLLLQHIFWGWNDDTHELSPAWLDGLDEAELRAALSQHIADVQANVGQIDGIVALNESLYQNIYNDRLGEDITYALFAAARQAFPDADLFINEFPWMPEDGSIEFGDLQTPIENYIAYVQRLDQNGVDFDRVGLQIYIGQDDVAAFGGIESLVAEVDARINQFTAETGRSLTITEFGLTAPDHALRAEYLGAFMRMAFANPNVDGFQVFHWLNEQVPDNALVLADGSLTQAGQVYYHLVLDEWTTRYQARTNDLGEINFSGIYGEYEIIVRHDNEEYTFTVDLSRDSPGEVELTLESVIGENYDG
ncbi:MAG: endo-1,4-beta-xylanase, partial [Anaerolineales bacterium]